MWAEQGLAQHLINSWWLHCQLHHILKQVFLGPSHLRRRLMVQMEAESASLAVCLEACTNDSGQAAAYGQVLGEAYGGPPLAAASLECATWTVTGPGFEVSGQS